MKKNLMKGILAAALALCLVVTGLFGNGWAVEAEDDTSSAETTESTDTSDESSGIILGKDADPLDENGQTTVTLTVGGDQSVENVAVLFVLDYSTSVKVRTAAADFVNELAQKENTNVKVCVINYYSNANEGTWTLIEDDTTAASLLAYENYSGTNYQAGLLAAEKALASDDIAGYTTYLITISDGITYLWTEDNGTSTMAVPYAQCGNNGYVYAAQTGADQWAMMYGYGTPLYDITNKDGSITEGAYDSLADFLSAMPEKIENTSSYFVGWGSEITNPIMVYSSDYGSNYATLNADVMKTYASGAEVAIYKTMTEYDSLLEMVDYAYAFKLDENHWTNYPWGEQLMDYLISSSDNSDSTASGVISDDTAATVFSTIKDEILYTIKSGVVTDVIGSNFDLVSNSFVLTVGGTALKGSVEGDTVYFGEKNEVSGEYPYSVMYNSETKTITWNINVPVEKAPSLKLSYKLYVSNTTPGVYEDSHTNEKAYIEPEGGEPEDFPDPTVSYVNISVTKTWVDNNNEQGLRPESITLKLVKNGDTYKTVTVTADAGWSYSFVGLPYVDGDDYTVEEEMAESDAENYTGTVLDNGDGTFTITNEITDTVDIAVSKAWDDSNNKDGIRPSSVKGCLVQDGLASMVYEFNLSAENNWTYTFTNMPKYENGVEIEWTAYEYETFTGYTVAYSYTTNEDGSISMVVTNTHEVTATETTDPTDPTDDTEETTTTTETTTETVSDPVVTTSAETGDNSNLELFVGLLAVCVVAMIALVTVETRKRTK